MRTSATLLSTLLALVGCKSGEPVPGDVAHFDPIAALPQVHEYVGNEHDGSDWHLVGIDVMGVRTDGTLDLVTTSHMPYAHYEFQRAAEPPKDAPPPGAGGSADGTWHETLYVNVRRPGTRSTTITTSGGGTTETTIVTKGMLADDPDVGPGPATPALDPPRCSLRDLWSHFDAAKLPANVVGNATYGRDGWLVSAASMTMRFDVDCKPI